MKPHPRGQPVGNGPPSPGEIHIKHQLPCTEPVYMVLYSISVGECFDNLGDSLVPQSGTNRAVGHRGRAEFVHPRSWREIPWWSVYPPHLPIVFASCRVFCQSHVGYRSKAPKMVTNGSRNIGVFSW
jgi:hypothetical protein